MEQLCATSMYNTARKVAILFPALWTPLPPDLATILKSRAALAIPHISTRDPSLPSHLVILRCAQDLRCACIQRTRLTLPCGGMENHRAAILTCVYRI